MSALLWLSRSLRLWTLKCQWTQSQTTTRDVVWNSKPQSECSAYEDIIQNLFYREFYMNKGKHWAYLLEELLWYLLIQLVGAQEKFFYWESEWLHMAQDNTRKIVMSQFGIFPNIFKQQTYDDVRLFLLLLTPEMRNNKMLSIIGFQATRI